MITGALSPCLAPVDRRILPFTGGQTPPYEPIALLYSGTANPIAQATGIATLQGALAAGRPASVPAAIWNAQIAAGYNNYFSQPNHPNVGLNGYLQLQQARGPFSPRHGLSRPLSGE